MSWKPLVAALILTPVLLVVAMVPCGVGHGNCLLFAFFFPVMALPELVGEAVNPLILACIQLPLYGVILGVALKKGYFKVVAVVLLVLHALAVFLVLQL